MSRTHAEIMSELMSRPKEERDKRIADLTKLCTCAECPTYEGTGETKLLFCIMGKGSAIKTEKECFCAPCPVTDAVELRTNFHCTRGSGLEQGRKE